jgi:hypothetical protein
VHAWGAHASSPPPRARSLAVVVTSEDAARSLGAALSAPTSVTRVRRVTGAWATRSALRSGRQPGRPAAGLLAEPYGERDEKSSQPSRAPALGSAVDASELRLP